MESSVEQVVSSAVSHQYLMGTVKGNTAKMFEFMKFIEHFNRLHHEGNDNSERLSYKNVLQDLRNIGVIDETVQNDMNHLCKVRHKIAHAFGPSKDLESRFINMESNYEQSMQEYIGRIKTWINNNPEKSKDKLPNYKAKDLTDTSSELTIKRDTTPVKDVYNYEG